VNASVRWRRQAACARKAANAAARMRASAPKTTSHEKRGPREDAAATVTSDAGGRRRRGTGETTGAKGAGARGHAKARDPAHDASDHPVDRRHLEDDDVPAARRVAEPRATGRAANGAIRAPDSANIVPVDRAPTIPTRRDTVRAHERREGGHDRATSGGRRREAGGAITDASTREILLSIVGQEFHLLPPLRRTRRVRSGPSVGHDIESSPSFSTRRLRPRLAPRSCRPSKHHSPAKRISSPQPSRGCFLRRRSLRPRRSARAREIEPGRVP
jgi:hypothetical protein